MSCFEVVFLAKVISDEQGDAESLQGGYATRILPEIYGDKNKCNGKPSLALILLTLFLRGFLPKGLSLTLDLRAAVAKMRPAVHLIHNVVLDGKCADVVGQLVFVTFL